MARCVKNVGFIWRWEMPFEPSILTDSLTTRTLVLGPDGMFLSLLLTFEGRTRPPHQMRKPRHARILTASPPLPDSFGALAHGRIEPGAAFRAVQTALLFDHLVGAAE